MSWKDFDILCDLHNEQVQANLERNAIQAVETALKQKSGLRDALSYAVGVATKEDSWVALAQVVQEHPCAMPSDVEGKFFTSCPAPLVEEIVAGEKGVFSRLLDQVGPKAEVDDGDIRLMHIVISALAALKQIERLKRVSKMFEQICAERKTGLPGSLRSRLVGLKVIEKPANGEHITKPGISPARTIEEKREKKEKREEAARAAGMHNPFAKALGGFKPESSSVH